MALSAPERLTVSAEERINGLAYGYIVDHLVKDGDIACFQALMNNSLDELKKRGCYVASTWAPGKPALSEELLKHLGFKSSLMFPYKRISARIYSTVRSIDEQMIAGVDVYEKENWRVTHAYSDTI